MKSHPDWMPTANYELAKAAPLKHLEVTSGRSLYEASV